MPKNVTPNMPLNTAVPKARRISPPAPSASTSGTTPKIKAKEVIKNRTQPQPAGFDGGFGADQAGVLFLFGEFDDENGVLAGQADQHDKSDLRENIIVHAARPDAQDGKEQAHRHDQDDRQGQRPAFVKCRQRQEDKEHAQRKNVK